MTTTLASDRKTAIEAAADRLTASRRLPPVPAHLIARTLGIDLSFDDFGPHARDAAAVTNFAAGRIHVNAAISRTAQLNAIAHELGHLVLHRTADLSAYAPLPSPFSTPDVPIDLEASHFAACLMLPRRLLEPVSGAAASRLAAIFMTTRLMVEERIADIRKTPATGPDSP